MSCCSPVSWDGRRQTDGDDTIQRLNVTLMTFLARIEADIIDIFVLMYATIFYDGYMRWLRLLFPLTDFCNSSRKVDILLLDFILLVTSVNIKWVSHRQPRIRVVCEFRSL